MPATSTCSSPALPRVLGVRQILEEWTAWRIGVRPPAGLLRHEEKAGQAAPAARACKQILLDIDKAIQIIRETEEDAEVIPNLMIGFGIDQIQAEYVAEIKLRNINKEYILKRVQETDALQDGDRRPGGHPGQLPRRHQARSSWTS